MSISKCVNAEEDQIKSSYVEANCLKEGPIRGNFNLYPQWASWSWAD